MKCFKQAYVQMPAHLGVYPGAQKSSDHKMLKDKTPVLVRYVEQNITVGVLHQTPS